MRPHYRHHLSLLCNIFKASFDSSHYRMDTTHLIISATVTLIHNTNFVLSPFKKYDNGKCYTMYWIPLQYTLCMTTFIVHRISLINNIYSIMYYFWVEWLICLRIFRLKRWMKKIIRKSLNSPISLKLSKVETFFWQLKIHF